MRRLSIVISKPPFGTIHAAEALRLANGAVSYGHDVSILLIGDGVFTAKRDQRAEEGGWTSLSPILEKLAASDRAKVFVDMKSSSERQLGESDLIKGAELVDEVKALSVTTGSDVVTVF